MWIMKGNIQIRILIFLVHISSYNCHFDATTVDPR